MLEKKLVESIRQRAASGENSFKSVNSIIMKFPQFKEGLRHIKDIFEQYGEFILVCPLFGYRALCTESWAWVWIHLFLNWAGLIALYRLASWSDVATIYPA